MFFLQFDETPLHVVASVCDDRSEKVGGFLAVAKLLIAKGADLFLLDNVRSMSLVSACTVLIRRRCLRRATKRPTTPP